MGNLLAGVLLHYFGIAVLLAVLTSLVLLAWYRRAVRRRMRERSAADVDRLAPIPEGRAARASAATGMGASRLRVRVVVVYTLGALAASAVSTRLYLWSFDVPFGAMRAFVMQYALAWPLIPTLVVMLTLSLRTAILLALGYYLAGAMVVLLWSFVSSAVLDRPDVSPLGNLLNYSGFLAIEVVPPLAVIVATGTRKLRPVMPLVLAGLLVFSFGAFALQTGFVSLLASAPLRGLLLAFPHADVVWFMLAALPVAYACWLALRGLARAYEAKAFSDTQFLADTWWLIAAFSTSVTLAGRLQWRGLLGLLAFVAYRAVVTVGLRLWPIEGATAGPRRLLLLRVFGYRRRTERLFDVVGERWRLAGSVQMIGGADLAGRTIDPGDIVSFAGGRLPDQFVGDRGDLERRLGALDEDRDPDGRFRVNEFLCHDDTWQETLESLLLRSDVVLMDLRGFSTANSGCLFELQKLAEQRRLERTLFVVDGTTDVDLLRHTLTQAAGNGGEQAGLVVNTINATRQSGHELDQILAKLSALSAA
jgi:hypothetical protein